MSYEDGLIHAVAVERSTDGHSARGGAKPEWQPVVGLEAVRARVVPCRPAEVIASERRGMRLTHKVMLPAGTRLTNRDRLVYIDPIAQTNRYLCVQSASDPHESGLRYVAMCEEQAT